MSSPSNPDSLCSHCGHARRAHEVDEACQAEIHYSSEEYPCMCRTFSGQGQECGDCGHDRVKHQRISRCRGRDGRCDCAEFTGGDNNS